MNPQSHRTIPILTCIVLLILLFSGIPLQAQSANIIALQPASGAPGSTVVIQDVSGTNRGKTCFVSINGTADSVGQMAGAITYVVPTNLAPQTITFVCTGGQDRQRSNTAAFVVTALTIVVQPADADGDGLPDTRDNCPTAAGAVENGGCPITVPAADSDGDGLPDVSDACPALAGIGANNGCPIPPSPTAPVVILPPLPTTGACVVATIDADMVNIRESASTRAAIVGRLNPADTANVLAKTTTDEGIWYQINGGWVAGWVTRQGGDCTSLADGLSNTVMVGEVVHTGLLVPAVQQIREVGSRMTNCPELVPQVGTLPTFLTLYIVGEPDPCAAAQTELDGLFLSAGQAPHYADGIDIEYLFSDCEDYNNYGYVYQFLTFMENLHYYDQETWQFIVDMLVSQHQFACNFAYELWNYTHIPESVPDPYAIPFAVTYCVGAGMSRAWFDKTVGFLNLIGMTREDVEEFSVASPDGIVSDCDLIGYVQPVGFVTTGNVLFFQLLDDTCQQTPTYAAERAFSVAVRGGFDAGAAANESCAGDALLESLPLPADFQPLLPRVATEVANCSGSFRLLATYNPALGMETLYTILKSIDPCAAAETYAYTGGFSAPVVPPPACIQGNQLVIEGTFTQSELVLNPSSSWRDKIRYLDRPVDEICTRIEDVGQGAFAVNPTPTLPQFAIEPTATPPILVIEPTLVIEPSATPLSVGVVATSVPEEPSPQPPLGDQPSAGQGAGVNEISLEDASGAESYPAANSGALALYTATDADGRFNGIYVLTNVRHTSTGGTTARYPLHFHNARADGYPVALSSDGQYVVYFTSGTDPAVDPIRQITVVIDPNAAFNPFEFQLDKPQLVYQHIRWTPSDAGGYAAAPDPDLSLMLNFAGGLTAAPYAPLSLPETGDEVLVLFESGIPSLYRLVYDGAGDVAVAERLVENAVAPAVSPNGRYIAFERADASGRNVYVMSTNSGEVHPITQQQDSECFAPQFGSDSLTLFFTCEGGGERKIFRYGLAGVSEFAVGVANAGNPMPSSATGFITFDDGQKVYIAREDGSQVATLLNFEFDGLRVSQMISARPSGDGAAQTQFFHGILSRFSAGK